jgi:hypothetical protein
MLRKIKLGTMLYRVRGTYGGNIADYKGPVRSDTAHGYIQNPAEAVTDKDKAKGKNLLTADTKDFCLNTVKRQRNTSLREWAIAHQPSSRNRAWYHSATEITRVN